MTILEDVFEEFLAEFGIEVTGYPHKGYDDGSDDIWYDDQGWDEANPYTFTATVRDYPDNEILDNMGFTNDVRVLLSTNEDVVDEGDKLTVSGRSWIARNVKTQQIQGREYRYIIGGISDGT